MPKLRSTFAVLTLLLVTGAGCFGIGGDDTVSVATGGIWVSESAGASWLSKSAMPTATAIATISGLDIMQIEQDPSDPSVLYLGSQTSGLFYSLDSGESWLRPEDPMATSGAILGIEVDPRNVCTYYVLKTNRLLKTTTCGREFDTETYVETRTDEGLVALAIDWYNPDTIYIGTTEGDVLRSLDGGETWAALLRLKNRVTDIEISNADSRTILVSTLSRGVFRTSDGGANWDDLKDGLAEFENASNAYDLEQTADGSRVLMRSEYGLLYSDDLGGTWNRIPLVTNSNEVTIWAAEISPVDKNVMYYATASTFYTSTSGGTAWSTAKLPSTRAAAVIHVDSDKTDRIFMGMRTLEE